MMIIDNSFVLLVNMNEIIQIYRSIAPQTNLLIMLTWFCSIILLSILYNECIWSRVRGKESISCNQNEFIETMVKKKLQFVSNLLKSFTIVYKMRMILRQFFLSNFQCLLNTFHCRIILSSSQI